MMPGMSPITYSIDVIYGVINCQKALIFYGYGLRPEYYDLDPVFCLVSNELTDPMELVINTHNRNVFHLDALPSILCLIFSMITALAILTFLYFSARCNVHQYELEKPMSLQAQWCLERDFPDEINAYIANTFTDREIADYGLTSLYFTRKDACRLIGFSSSYWCTSSPPKSMILFHLDALPSILCLIFSWHHRLYRHDIYYQTLIEA